MKFFKFSSTSERSKTSTRGDSGFTMIEVLAALAILLVAFYMLLELRQTSLQSATFASRKLLAVQVARMKMEETLSRGFPDPCLESDTVAGLPVAVNVMNIGNDTDLAALRKIQVAVTFEMGFGEDNKVILTTIVAPMRIKQLPKPDEELR